MPTRSGAPRRSSASRPTRRSGCPTRSSTCTGEAIRAGEAARAATWERPARGLDRRPGRAATPASRAAGVPGGTRSCRRGRPASQVATPATPARLPQRRRSTSCPALMAGGADLTGNTGTQLKDNGVPVRRATPSGRLIYYGVREHGMGAAMNGMALHGGVAARRRHVLRLQRLHARRRCGWPPMSEANVIYSWTHDSVGARRGRAHPPADRAARLRCGPCPGCASSGRPTPTRRRMRGGSRSTATARRRSSSAARTSRCSRAPPRPLDGVATGAYVLVDTDEDPDLVLHRHRERGAACASRPRPLLAADGITARVVSMPCWELFGEQDDDYQRRGAPRRRARRWPSRPGRIVRLGAVGRRRR